MAAAKKRNAEAARKSVVVASWVGLVGILATLYTGHGSAVEVSRHQPMKLAAMEGLYRGSCGQDLVAVGILKPEDKRTAEDPMLFSIDIPADFRSWPILISTHSYQESTTLSKAAQSQSRTTPSTASRMHTKWH